jgi:hypothetical protein
MSLNGSSLDPWDFLGISTRWEGDGIYREEKSMREDLPVERIYQEFPEEIHREEHPIIHQWRQSIQVVPMNLNFTRSEYGPPRNSYTHLWDDWTSTSLEAVPSIRRSGPPYINPFHDDELFPRYSDPIAAPMAEIPLRKSPVLDGEDIENSREHPLYQRATTSPDGLYHCPWEGRDPYCNHKPEKLRCNYEYAYFSIR